MKVKLVDEKRNLYAAMIGSAVMLLLSLGLSALSAGMVSKGIVPYKHMEAAGWMITAISALIGSAVCGRMADSGRLPMCMLAGILYLLISFMLRGLFFRSVGERLWTVPVCVLVPAALGAILASGERKRKR